MTGLSRHVEGCDNWQFSPPAWGWSDRAVECIEDCGFKGEEVRSLAPLQFVARNLDSGGELRGKIEV